MRANVGSKIKNTRGNAVNFFRHFSRFVIFSWFLSVLAYQKIGVAVRTVQYK